MKTLRLIGMALVAIMMCVNFTSCSDGDDEEQDTCKSNAKGKLIIFDTHSLETEDMYFWINDYVVKNFSIDGRDIAYLKDLRYNYSYKPFTMDLVYQNLSADYHTEIDENFKDFSRLVPNPENYIRYMKSLIGSYDYICFDGGTYLFNRTSDINYN